MLQRKMSTALAVLAKDGVRGVARISIEKAGMWWREGEAVDFGKFVGRPAPVARLDGCRFFLDTPEVGDSLRYLLLSGKHEAPERRLAKRWLDPNLPLVELGASTGVVSCVTNRLLADPTRHAVVEANPKLIPLLKRNRALNRCLFAVQHAAVAYDAAAVPFHLSQEAISSSLRQQTEDVAVVPATTLSTVLDDQSFDRCTLICDIEGAEVDLVNYEASVLATRVAMLIIEVHPRLIGEEPIAQVRAQLQKSGFEEVDHDWDTLAFRNDRF
jgi:FkbM family methyltransferase